MKIGLFTDTYPPFINGVSTSVLMLKRALEKKGHDVYVVSVNDNLISYDYDEKNKILKMPGIPTGIYDYRLTSIYPIRIINKVRKWDLDVIHSHTEFGVGTFARLFAKQFDIPLVHTYHTMYEDYVHYITNNYFKKTGKRLIEYLTSFYCDKTADELIVPSLKTYRLFKEKYKYTKNIHIIPTGIEIDRFLPKKFKQTEIDQLRKELKIKDNFVLLFVGRVAKEKNIDFLIRNHHKIMKKFPQAAILIVGDGPELEKYKKDVTKRKLENNIIFTGRVLFEKIGLYYQISDAFVTASLSETQGLTIIEAMAAEKPVICIEDENFKSVITDNENGLIFKNVKQYVEKVSLLIENSEAYEKIVQNAKISAIEYSSKVFATRVIDVYKQAIIKKGKTKGIVKRIIKEFKKGISNGKTNSI
jgi:1,2-diacylglycerol 3-alpha-glucosyltransferase